MKKQAYNLEERLLEYSVRITKFVELFPNTRVGGHVAGQLPRSGTSPYPNYGEAYTAESPKDFIHKGMTSDLSKQMKSNCGAQRPHYSMFNVGCSTFDVQFFKTTLSGDNATCERRQTS